MKLCELLSALSCEETVSIWLGCDHLYRGQVDTFTKSLVFPVFSDKTVLGIVSVPCHGDSFIEIQIVR